MTYDPEEFIPYDPYNPYPPYIPDYDPNTFITTYITCPNCKSAIIWHLGTKFCPYCGYNFYPNKQCCGRHWSDSFNYCPLCGKKLEDLIKSETLNKPDVNNISDKQ